MTTCQYCDSDRVVPVLDKNIEERNEPGNKYRWLCEACKRFGHLTGKDEFQKADNAKIIPVGQERTAGNAIPAAAASDGGQTPETPADDGEEPETDPVNEFDCPACSASLTGYPKACPKCGVDFNWGGANE